MYGGEFAHIFDVAFDATGACRTPASVLNIVGGGIPPMAVFAFPSHFGRAFEIGF